jgi:hypothetical protein
LLGSFRSSLVNKLKGLDKFNSSKRKNGILQPEELTSLKELGQTNFWWKAGQILGLHLCASSLLGLLLLSR